MRIKRFIAPDMRTALRMVRDEQGPDAVILSNRATADGIEVVDPHRLPGSEHLADDAPIVDPSPVPDRKGRCGTVGPAGDHPCPLRIIDPQ